MRIVKCRQQTEEWDRWRARPTASEFDKFITPAKGLYSASAIEYAGKIVAKQRGAYTEPPPSFWMMYGTEMEPNAKAAYTKETGREIQDVGFILPDDTDSYGGSPDGLVGDDGLIEIKCPKPETLIAITVKAHDKDGELLLDYELPLDYKAQIQGLLMISERAWCDFYMFHPLFKPFLFRVYPDYEYHAKIAENLLLLLRDIERIKLLVPAMQHELMSVGEFGTPQIGWDDD